MKKFFIYIRDILVAFFLKIKVLFWGSPDNISSLNVCSNEVQRELNPEALVSHQSRSADKQEALSSELLSFLELLKLLTLLLKVCISEFLGKETDTSLKEFLSALPSQLQVLTTTLGKNSGQQNSFIDNHQPVKKRVEEQLEGNIRECREMENDKESSLQKTPKVLDIKSQVTPTVKKSSRTLSSEKKVIPTAPPMPLQIQKLTTTIVKNSGQQNNFIDNNQPVKVSNLIDHEGLKKARENLRKVEMREAGGSRSSSDKKKEDLFEALKRQVNDRFSVPEVKETNNLNSGSFTSLDEWEDQAPLPQLQELTAIVGKNSGQQNNSRDKHGSSLKGEYKITHNEKVKGNERDLRIEQLRIRRSVVAGDEGLEDNSVTI